MPIIGTAARSVAAGGILLTLSLTLTACGAETEDGQFRAAATNEALPCLEHQPDTPGRAYTAGPEADTAAIFTMLRYYTTNKATTGYCDGKSPTDTDRAWARLYVDLGAEPGNVSHLLG